MRKLIKWIKGKYIISRAEKIAIKGIEGIKDIDGDYFTIGKKKYWVDIAHGKYVERASTREKCKEVI